MPEGVVIRNNNKSGCQCSTVGCLIEDKKLFCLGFYAVSIVFQSLNADSSQIHVFWTIFNHYLKTLVRCGRGSNPRTPAHEADALTTRPPRRSEDKKSKSKKGHNSGKKNAKSFGLSHLIVWIALWIVNTYSEFQVNIFCYNRDITKCQGFSMSKKGA